MNSAMNDNRFAELFAQVYAEKVQLTIGNDKEALLPSHLLKIINRVAAFHEVGNIKGDLPANIMNPNDLNVLTIYTKNGDCHAFGEYHKFVSSFVSKDHMYPAMGQFEWQPTDGNKFRVTYVESVWSVTIRFANFEACKSVIERALLMHAPSGHDVVFQADTHPSSTNGSILIGTTMVVNGRSIPIAQISADIGCGISVIPVGSSVTAQAFNKVCVSGAFVRGDASLPKIIRPFFDSAIKFAGLSPEWFMGAYTTFVDLGLLNTNRKNPIEYVKTYMMGFVGSLGSSGNHFAELGELLGEHYLVIHSGSRNLGAKVFQVLSNMAEYTTGSKLVCFGELATLYLEAYHILQKFAEVNRITVALAILDQLNPGWSKQTVDESALAKMIRGSSVDVAMEMMYGLTHNGIKHFVNHETRQQIFIVCKGSITVSSRGAMVITPISSTEGTLFNLLVDPNCKWEESHGAGYDYEVLTAIPDEIYTGPHGGGRNKSASDNARLTTYSDLLLENVNVAPGSLTDSSGGYNTLEYVRSRLYLPEHAHVWCLVMKTVMTFKDGFGKGSIRFAEFVIEVAKDIDRHRSHLWKIDGFHIQLLLEMVKSRKGGAMEKLAGEFTSAASTVLAHM